MTILYDLLFERCLNLCLSINFIIYLSIFMTYHVAGNIYFISLNAHSCSHTGRIAVSWERRCSYEVTFSDNRDGNCFFLPEFQKGSSALEGHLKLKFVNSVMVNNFNCIMHWKKHSFPEMDANYQWLHFTSFWKQPVVQLPDLIFICVCLCFLCEIRYEAII